MKLSGSDMNYVVVFVILLFSSPGFSQPAAAPVTVADVQQAPIFHELQLIGTVTSSQVALLSTQINGLTRNVYVDDGDSVTQGQVLLDLDDELAQIQLDSAKATVEQATRALIDAKRRLEEAKLLSKDRSIAQSTVLDIEAEVEIDKATLRKEQAQANYQAAILQRHQLTAPFSGVISRKLIEQGEWVSNGKGIIELVNTKDLRLDFYLDEEYLSKIDVEGELRFSLNVQPEIIYNGKIATVVPVSDPNARTFLLRVNINPDQFGDNLHIIPGMSVKATLQVSAGRQGLIISRDALLRNQDGRITVWTISNSNEGTTAQENRVETGLVFAGKIEIKSGLEANDKVVIGGNETLRNGQRVLITN